MKWKIFDTGRRSAKENMAIDRALLNDLEQDQSPVLHLYNWEGPSATYGYFLDPYKFLKKEAVILRGLNLARRPTGGGIVLHLNDFAFSILVPASHPAYSVNTLENYASVNRLVGQVVKKVIPSEESPTLLLEKLGAELKDAKHFCMALPTVHDVMLEGKKVGGGAQRRTRHGFLHQGTLSFNLPDLSLMEEILQDTGLVNSFLKTSYVASHRIPKTEIAETLIHSLNFLESF